MEDFPRSRGAEKDLEAPRRDNACHEGGATKDAFQRRQGSLFLLDIFSQVHKIHIRLLWRFCAGLWRPQGACWEPLRRGAARSLAIWVCNRAHIAHFFYTKCTLIDTKIIRSYKHFMAEHLPFPTT
jgi:hypothetical protein